MSRNHFGGFRHSELGFGSNGPEHVFRMPRVPTCRIEIVDEDLAVDLSTIPLDAASMAQSGTVTLTDGMVLAAGRVRSYNRFVIRDQQRNTSSMCALSLEGSEEVFYLFDDPVTLAGTCHILTVARAMPAPLSLLSTRGPACFCAGTLIATPTGQRLAEELRPGDLVLTRGHGPRKVLDLSVKPLFLGSHNRDQTPVIIPARSFGDYPSADLNLAPRHRLLVGGAQLELMFGLSEALVAAGGLVGLNGISVAHGQDMAVYCHLAFENHEILCVNGVWTESLHPALMDSTISLGAHETVAPVRPALRPWEAETLAASGLKILTQEDEPDATLALSA